MPSGGDKFEIEGIVPARDEPASRGVPEAYRGEPIRIEMRIGEPGRNRTYNQQIKSLRQSQVPKSQLVISRTNL